MPDRSPNDGGFIYLIIRLAVEQFVKNWRIISKIFSLLFGHLKCHLHVDLLNLAHEWNQDRPYQGNTKDLSGPYKVCTDPIVQSWYERNSENPAPVLQFFLALQYCNFYLEIMRGEKIAEWNLIFLSCSQDIPIRPP
jgi:hypothetical protein